MVIVVRAELRLTAGKTAVQVAHAAVQLVRLAEEKEPKLLKGWLAEGQRKIAVTARTLDELEELSRKARSRGLLTTIVEDAGFTEIPAGTRTCLGVGPGRSSDVDTVTGHLPLL